VSPVYQESTDGRQVSERFKNHERRLKQLEKFDAGQQQQTVVTVVAARDEAVAAKDQAVAAASRTPGNLFDDAPIRTQNATGWRVQASSGDVSLTFLSDGFEVTSASGGGYIQVANLLPVPVTDSISFASNFLAEYPDGQLPQGDAGIYMSVRRVAADGATANLGYGAGNKTTNGWYDPSLSSITRVDYGSTSTAGVPTVAVLPFIEVIFPSAPGFRVRIRQPFMRLVSGTVDLGAATVTAGNLDADTRGRLARRGYFSMLNPTANQAEWVSAPAGGFTELGVPTNSSVVQTNTLNDGAAGTIIGGYITAPFTGLYDVAAIVRFNGNSSGTVRAAGFRVSPTGSASAPTQRLIVDRRATGTFPPVAAVSVATGRILEANAGDRIWVACTHDATATITVKLEDFTVRYVGT